MLGTAVTVGVGLMVIGCVTVVVPHSLVTAKLMVCVPEVLNKTVPGEELFELKGVPPLNCQL